MLRTSLPAGRVAGLPRDARRTLLPSRRVVARAMDLRDAMRVLRVGEDPPPVTSAWASVEYWCSFNPSLS